MKKALIYTSIILALFYLVGSFIYAGFNIVQWGEDGRRVLAVFALMAALITMVLVLAEGDDNKKQKL